MRRATVAGAAAFGCLRIRAPVRVMAFGLWIDESRGLAWAQGTHEYRPLGAAVIAVTDQFRGHDFRKTARHPRHLKSGFVGLFASLEDVNRHLRTHRGKLRATPDYVR